MLIISTSDKGGTGRSVTTCNVGYRQALQGRNVCYLDFDFGSPTSGAIFNVEHVARGTVKDGLHTYLQSEDSLLEPHRVDIWEESNRRALGSRPPGAGRLVLLPGDQGGGEFPMGALAVERCVDLLYELHKEFDICLLDLSAGRSHAAEMVLEATAHPKVREMGVRWLVFHRWTRQHVTAASGLVFGEHGLLEIGETFGHDPGALRGMIRFVRTAVIAPNSAEVIGLKATQQAWLRRVDDELNERAGKLRLGLSSVIASVPLDPVLQWREQLITDEDVHSAGIANHATVQAFERLASDVLSDRAWDRL